MFSCELAGQVGDVCYRDWACGRRKFAESVQYVDIVDSQLACDRAAATNHATARCLQAALHKSARSVQRKNSALPADEFLADVVRQSQRAVAAGTDFRNATAAQRQASRNRDLCVRIAHRQSCSGAVVVQDEIRRLPCRDDMACLNAVGRFKRSRGDLVRYC